MKICHIITRMIIGGAQENTLLTVIGHLEKGHEVTLLTGPTTGPEGKLLQQENLPDFPIIENKNLVREINPIKDIFALISMISFFKKNKFNVVHTHASKAGIIGRIAAKIAGVPFIVHTVHGQAFHQYEKPWKNWIYKTSEKFSAKFCHKIYAVAQAMIDQCVDAKIAPREKYKVVYSGMDLEPYLNSNEVTNSETRKELNIPENAKVIGAVARLFPLKGYEYFIPVAAKIAEKYPDIKFLIVGNGIMKEQLEKEIAELGLTNNFVFTGLVPPSTIYKYTSVMDILIHLSLREGLPRTVVQALASAKPAIGYDLDGTPEVIRDGITGYINKPKSVDEVAENAIRLLDNPELAKEMGSKGRELVKEQFCWRKMADILEEEYLLGIRN